MTDIGQMLFWNKRIFWWLTGIMFILNNTFIQVRHNSISRRGVHD